MEPFWPKRQRAIMFMRAGCRRTRDSSSRGCTESKRTAILSGLTKHSTPTDPARPLPLGLPLFLQIPGLRYVGVDCSQIPQMQYTQQQLKSIKNPRGGQTLGSNFHGSPEEDSKGIWLQTQQSNSFHSEATVVPQPMNRSLLLRLERKCELFKGTGQGRS